MFVGIIIIAGGLPRFLVSQLHPICAGLGHAVAPAVSKSDASAIIHKLEDCLLSFRSPILALSEGMPDDDGL